MSKPETPREERVELPDGYAATITPDVIRFGGPDGREVLALSRAQMEELAGAQSALWGQLRPLDQGFVGVLLGQGGILQNYAPPFYDGQGPRLTIQNAGLDRETGGYVLWVRDRVTGATYELRCRADLDAMCDALWQAKDRERTGGA